MIRYKMVLLVLFLNLFNLKGQVADPGFAKYLFDKGNYNDLITLDKMQKSGLKASQKDSLNFYTGLSYYNLQLLDESNAKLESIQVESELFNPAMFFAGWNEMYLGNPGRALELVQRVNPSDDSEKELLQMMRSGCAIMQRDSQEAELILEQSLNQRRKYIPQWDRIQMHNNRLKDFQPKSYAAAGIFSSLVPGSGKIYAGQKGAGVSSFLTVAAIGAIFLENGIKTGWDSWNTIATAGIFGVFYLGNIYGSIIGIKIYRERFFNELNRAILLDINIPLRNIYLQ